MNDSVIDDKDLILNTNSRIPVCLCIDTSANMGIADRTGVSGAIRIKKGIERFLREIHKNSATRNSAEVAIVGFSKTPYLVQGFRTIDNFEKDLELVTKGNGDLGLGVEYALDLLELRKNKYKELGTDYYQPWLIIMSDDKPVTDEKSHRKLLEVQSRIREKEANNKLTVITVYVGENDGDIQNRLAGFSRKNPPQIVESTKFSDFFEWLGKSVSTVSLESDVKLDFADLTDWDEI